jgi:hypothetical protein
MLTFKQLAQIKALVCNQELAMMRWHALRYRLHVFCSDHQQTAHSLGELYLAKACRRRANMLIDGLTVPVYPVGQVPECPRYPTM